MNKRKVLFITEGEIDEPSFIDKVFTKCYPDIEYKYYEYSTDIYTLANLIFDNTNNIDEYLDIKSVLRANEKIEYRKEKLSEKYSDIILVFDFDPQSGRPKFEKIKKMLKFFNDSTNNGKLYINYPMMQSYKHLRGFIDNEFKDRYIELEKCNNYKEIVNEESILKDLKKYSYPIIMNLLGKHLKKANFILKNKYEIPTYTDFFEINLNEIYDIQCNSLKENKRIYVLNTFIFCLVEYNPNIMLNKIKEYEDFEPKKF